MRLCTPSESLIGKDVFFENKKDKIKKFDYILIDEGSLSFECPKEVKKVFFGDVNSVASVEGFSYFFAKESSVEEVYTFLKKDFEKNKASQKELALSEIGTELEEKASITESLQKESDLHKKESTNIKGLGEYVIRLLGVNTMEQLVYETESLRILKYKGIKVSLIYIDSRDGFLCTRNTTRKIKGLGDVEDWSTFVEDRKKLANILSRPVLNHFKVYSEKLETGDSLYALFESQEEFLEKDYFLMMLKKLLFTNFVRVLQSERLLKNSSLLSQAFQQIQSTSLLIGSDFTVLFSNQKESLNQKCYKYMFNRMEPCTGCPIINDLGEASSTREVALLEDEFVVHSSKVKNLNNSFYLHIYETEENSKKRESIKIQRGKLQSLGLVTQALTHELNNPLTGILELSQEMSLDFEGQTAEDLEEISSAAKRCLSIIEDLKKFSSKKIEFSRVNFSEIVRSSLVLTKVLTRNASIYADLDDDVWISGSNTLLSQLVFNIIKNSVEAMDGDGSISISLKKEKGEAVLLFEDTGPGLPKGMNNVSLFGTKNKEKGSGFGLFLVNEFVKLHKGQLSFGNLPEKGAYFSINVPLT
ncbi:MAG: sensor histidine kinase [Bdellovibrionales bacterium]